MKLLQGDQLEIDFSEIGFDLDKPQYSICPQCSSDIIKLADGCDVCGWHENQSSSVGSYSIPCTVKQPNQPELSGVIKQDLGSRFIVYLPSEGSTVTIPKLLVYPDFSQLDKSPRKNAPSSKNCSSKQSPPSKIPPSKNRRRKGEGTGYIYRRTITRRGNQYQESYYRYRDESGKLRSKYIPQRLLDRVEDAESLKLPIADVLRLLGVNEISRGEQSSTSEFINRGEQVNNPSTKRCDPATTTVARERAPRQNFYFSSFSSWRMVTSSNPRSPKSSLAKKLSKKTQR